MVTPTRSQVKTTTGGEIIARMLAAEGVARVFGIIDGTYFGLYSSFEPQGIQLFTPRHETSAAHMAGAYARLTGKLGVCMASNGPGVANILPGAVVEAAEGNRVLLITSCRREGIAYPERGGTYQYFPQTEVIGAFAKWSCAVPSVDRLEELMRKAFRAAYSGRPGVVHVDVPESVMNGTFPMNPKGLRGPASYRTLEPMEPSPKLIEAARALLLDAKTPMIHAGSGIIHAQAFAELAELAALLKAPVTTSWAARAAIDERSPFAVPMPYVDAVKQARCEADVVLTLGARIGESDFWGKPPFWASPAQQRMIQVDVEAEALGRTKPVDVAVQGDVKRFLQQLIAALRPVALQMPLASREATLQKLRKHCQDRRRVLNKKLRARGTPMHSAHVAGLCQEAFEEDSVVVIDGGNTSIWAHFYHEVRTPNTLLGTAKMGMLGAGCSQALGAAVARPEQQIYCIIGDGAMGFHPQEIETAVRHGLNIIYLVLCDKQWGMVKMNQQFALKPLKTLAMKALRKDETLSADLGEIAFDVLARAMGAYGERVSDPAGLKGALARAQAAGGCAVIHIDVDPVAHMWAPNLKTFKDMHQEPQG